MSKERKSSTVPYKVEGDIMKWVISYIEENNVIVFAEVANQEDIESELIKLTNKVPTVSHIKIERKR